MLHKNVRKVLRSPPHRGRHPHPKAVIFKAEGTLQQGHGRTKGQGILLPPQNTQSSVVRSLVYFESKLPFRLE